MKYDYKTEHRENILFAIEKRGSALIVSLLICAGAFYIINKLLNDRLSESLKNGYVQLTLIIIIVIIIICVIKSIHSLCKYLDFQFELRKLRIEATSQSLQFCTQLYRRTKSGIDTVKTIIDVLKSFSPIPLTVLLFGFLIDKNKAATLNWNIYTIVLIVAILIYITLLKRYLDNYEIFKTRLLDIQDALDSIRNQLQESNSTTTKINNRNEPIFKDF